jgi:hypothetical protein
VPVLDPGRGKTKTGYFWAMRNTYFFGLCETDAEKSAFAGPAASCSRCLSGNGMPSGSETPNEHDAHETHQSRDRAERLVNGCIH